MTSITPTRSRNVFDLSGVWNFRVDSANSGFDEGWFAGPLDGARTMPVPSSFNDVTLDTDERDHVGYLWYQRSVVVPRTPDGDHFVLRFGSATHSAVVWVDGVEVARHEGGYLPFEADITEQIEGKEEFLLTVAVDNRLSWQTIPPGYVAKDSRGRDVQNYYHDFYNYCGLHRAVLLYTRPDVHVSDVTVVTDVDGTTGVVTYDVVADGASEVSVVLLDADGASVATGVGASGELRVENANLWAPGRGYLYTLRITADTDVFDQTVGIRTVEVKDSRLLINGVPFYFRGYGRHEDNIVRGKGHDNVMMVHDFELMQWQGANSFRTSHYPYAEEVMDYADRMGFVVIDETPAVGMNTGLSGGIFGGEPKPTFSEDTINAQTQQAHAREIRELIARDKNHPSVVIWSIANEPETNTDASREYFEPLVKVAREADPTRPVGYVNVMLSTPPVEKIMDLFDVVMLNRYYGWYVNTGNLADAEAALRTEIDQWIEKYPGKPIIFTEYGPDTLAGLSDFHRRPWSEEFQADMLGMYHRVFDDYPEVIGEQMWNFADFLTTPGIMRVGGNKKGMFTRDRLPKRAAYEVRERWLTMQEKLGF
ncbi:beta-glucuronidase [Arcanobacterium wilhelmae]|uniref:Beta-glucuronidase n=1 Tax=Arcanobacterium wilhelmae TaxID=1803177 RepID=A0ABT9NCA5_9ACTO|nr:beta-glucuronidase [Arcanobacterium wilhelmae]MDP9801340.1 beta-glucuronidase [Arcanobacterium wilhelmae]WFN90678.1 beta-glucuronidase [Arcanobacterium wilhelmae]